jgi:hypothetical protein
MNLISMKTSKTLLRQKYRNEKESGDGGGEVVRK